MSSVTTVRILPRMAAFNRQKGSYMIVRGDLPFGMAPVAEVVDRDGRGFSIREIDQAEISLSFDYTLAWITARTSTAAQAYSLGKLARDALLKADITFTSASGFAHEHLFVPSDEAPEAMVLLNEVGAQFRMRE